MKTLAQYLNESLITEAVKPQFMVKDWDSVLSQFKPVYSNYSQLAGLESFIDEQNDEGAEEWIDSMISGGVKDTQENRDILADIYKWAIDTYETSLYGWRDGADDILDTLKGLKSYEWGVSQEDYAMFVFAKKNLSGNNKKYGEILAKKGDSGDLADIASEYTDDSENW